MTPPSADPLSRRPAVIAVAAVCLLCLLLAFWPTLGETAHAWSTNPQYSHGYLVPLFAAVLLWLRRDRLDVDAVAPSWWGLPLVAAAVAMRLTGAYYHHVWCDALSLVPCLAGLVLAVGGRAAWRWAWPAVLFLL